MKTESLNLEDNVIIFQGGYQKSLTHQATSELRDEIRAREDEIIKMNFTPSQSGSFSAASTKDPVARNYSQLNGKYDKNFLSCFVFISICSFILQIQFLDMTEKMKAHLSTHTYNLKIEVALFFDDL